MYARMLNETYPPTCSSACYLSMILGMLSMFITPLSFMYIFLIHIRVICEVPQTGDGIKSQDENSTQERNRTDQTGFLT
jgi:hypothetical protein